jgi:hypothetical protein
VNDHVRRLAEMVDLGAVIERSGRPVSQLRALSLTMTPLHFSALNSSA